MKPEEKAVMEIVSMDDFYAFRDSLNLTDRQKDIFERRYSRGWLVSDISEDLGYCPAIIREDMRIIKKKLVAVMKESLEKDLTL